MDFLGYCDEAPTFNYKKQKWNYVQLDYPDNQKYNNAISAIFKGIKHNDSRFYVADPDNEKYNIILLDVRFNTEKKMIRIWPHECWPSKKSSE